MSRVRKSTSKSRRGLLGGSKAHRKSLPRPKCHLKLTKSSRKPECDIRSFKARIEQITLKRLGPDRKVSMLAEQGDKKSRISQWHRLGIFQYSGEHPERYAYWKATVKIYSEAKGLNDFIFAKDYPPEPTDEVARATWADKRWLAFSLLSRSLKGDESENLGELGVTALSDNSLDSIRLYAQATAYFEREIDQKIEDGHSPEGADHKDERHKKNWKWVTEFLALDGMNFPNLNAMVSHVDEMLTRGRRVIWGQWRLPWSVSIL